MHIELDATGGFIRVRLSGQQSMESLLEALARMEAHPAFRPELNRLWDLSEASLAALTQADLGRIAEITTARGPDAPGARVAVLVARDVDFGLMRMIDLLTENARPDDLQVFRVAEHAESWLAGRL